MLLGYVRWLGWRPARDKEMVILIDLETESMLLHQRTIVRTRPVRAYHSSVISEVQPAKHWKFRHSTSGEIFPPYVAATIAAGSPINFWKWAYLQCE